MLNLPSMAKCTGCPQDFILLHTLDCPLSMKHCVFIELYSGLISSFCDSGSLSLMMPLDCTHSPYPLPRNSVQMSLIAKFLSWVSLKCEHHLSVYLLDRCLQIHIPHMSLLYSPKFSNFNSNVLFIYAKRLIFCDFSAFSPHKRHPVSKQLLLWTLPFRSM